MVIKIEICKAYQKGKWDIRIGDIEGSSESGNITEEELIEERHFGKDLNGRVDFSIEPQGNKLIKGKNKFLKENWKLSN